jgi:hypothetical protein
MTRVLSIVIFAVAVAWPLSVVAQSTSAFPDFSAKRVKPPAPGAKKRINVQIGSAPRTTAPILPTDVVAPKGAPVSLYGWFWDAIDPATATSSGPGRVTDALEVLSTPSAQEALPPPRLQALQDIVALYGLDIMLATIGTDVSPALALSVIYVESAGVVNAESGAGAQGLMQLIPATATRFDVSDPFDPKQNITGGVRYLDWLMREFGEDPVLVLAAYNSGENAVKNNQGVPPFAETRNYVPRVLSAFSVAKGLCITPPLLASDGCVFANLAN